MILTQTTSATAENLKQIISDLQKHPNIKIAILSTGDGIPVNSINEEDNKAAAVAGFMLASAHQGFAMLNLFSSEEIVIRNSKHQLFVSRIFQMGDSRLILIVLFEKEIAYKRLINRAIKDIVTMMEK